MFTSSHPAGASVSVEAVRLRGGRIKMRGGLCINLPPHPSNPQQTNLTQAEKGRLRPIDFLFEKLGKTVRLISNSLLRDFQFAQLYFL